MSTNAEIARIFEEVSAMLQLQGTNRFKVIAYDNAARSLLGLTTDVTELASDIKQLTALDGIGDSTAKKIIEYIKTGKIAHHQKLLDEVPAGLLDVMKIPGLGPKSVKIMWNEAGVIDVNSLKTAMDAGKIEQLPRMGKKTVQNIRDSLEFLTKAAQRTKLGVALPIAEEFISRLSDIDGVQQIEYAGSLRRGSETIGDIDILASTNHPAKLAEAFVNMPEVEKILVEGSTKCSVRIERGIQIDLRIVDSAAFGAALMYFTGSKEHNIALREIAIKKDMRLNEYGLFPVDDKDADESPQSRGIEPIAAATESEIYHALDLAFVPPELRESRGELTSDIPKMIELKDIKAELHAHTIASDGQLTIEELANEAKRRGFHTIAVTDHSKSSFQANGLSEDLLREHIAAIHEADTNIKSIKILAGSEVDILTDGTLDYDDDLLAELDIVVASPHVALSQDRKKATARLIRAIENPNVHILGHPSGRLIGRREGMDIDINAIAAAAAEYDVALEINASFWRLDLRDTHVKSALEAGAKIAINTDAHAADNFDNLRYGVLTGRRGWLTKEHCINCWSKTRLHKWLKSKR